MSQPHWFASYSLKQSINWPLKHLVGIRRGENHISTSLRTSYCPHCSLTSCHWGSSQVTWTLEGRECLSVATCSQHHLAGLASRISPSHSTAHHPHHPYVSKRCSCFWGVWGISQVLKGSSIHYSALAVVSAHWFPSPEPAMKIRCQCSCCGQDVLLSSGCQNGITPLPEPQCAWAGILAGLALSCIHSQLEGWQLGLMTWGCFTCVIFSNSHNSQQPCKVDISIIPFTNRKTKTQRGSATCQHASLSSQAGIPARLSPTPSLLGLTSITPTSLAK